MDAPPVQFATTSTLLGTPKGRTHAVRLEAMLTLLYGALLTWLGLGLALLNSLACLRALTQHVVEGAGLEVAGALGRHLIGVTTRYRARGRTALLGLHWLWLHWLWLHWLGLH